MMAGSHYDYIIVGSGAGGSAAAWRLAQGGRRILVLEKGERLPTDGSTLDIERVLRRKVFTSTEPWLTSNGRKVVLKEYFNIGGKTKWSGGALIRFQRQEFEAELGYQARAWPIGYDDLEPYYAVAEKLLAVRSFAIEPDLERLLGGLHRCDPKWEQCPLPLGLAPQILDHPEEARRFDGGFASPRGLKSDAEICFLDRLKGVNHVEIVSGKEVTTLEPVDGNPRRVAVVACADGSRYRANTIVLAAGALHSPRLVQRFLQRSGMSAASRSFGQVGGNYKHHLNSSFLAISTHRITDPLRKTVVLFHPTCPHSSIQTVGWMDGDLLGGRLPELVPQGLANAIGTRSYGFWLSTEDGSSPENRVVDSNGGACPMLDYDAARVPEAKLEHRRLRRLFRIHLLRLGRLVLTRMGTIQGTAYACGTLAAGTDPNTSVIAADGRVHALDNLYVADGSALPRSGRVNPALTIYAWALRVADLLEGRAPM